MDIRQSVRHFIDRKRDLRHVIAICGHFRVEHWRANRLIDEFTFLNGVKNAGKNLFLDAMFHGVTPLTPWYVGLIDATGWTAEAASDTLASHSGWSEFTSYTGNRLAWGEGVAAAGAMSNAVPITFPILAAGSLKGVLIASVATGTAGVLWSTADFPSIKNVAISDSFKVTYSVSL